jgi:hypothetical protein
MHITYNPLTNVIINILGKLPPDSIKLLGYVAEGKHFDPVDYVEKNELHYGTFTSLTPNDIRDIEISNRLTYKNSNTEGRLIEWQCLVYKEINKTPSNLVKIHFNEYSFDYKKSINENGTSHDYRLEEWLNLNKI